MEIKDGYLYFETKYTIQNKKKITGHSFVDLCGFNPYGKKGDCVLSLLKFRKDQTDPKYRNRGDAAEYIVSLVLKKNNVEYIYYTEEDKKNNNYDFFQHYSQCGGIPDFEIPKDDYLIEVKSKPLSKYDEIVKEQPINEVEQGLYYAYLRGYKKARLIWVFFDEATENEVFAGKKPTTLANIKFLSKDYYVNKEEQKKLLYEALLYYNKCVMEKKIPLADISQKVLVELKDSGLLKGDDNGFRL